eukprot:30828-Pelagococcus_subviridis.AAC.10
MFACHTTRTLVTKNVPRLPCSLLRFHTPDIRLYVSSFGSSFSSLSAMIAPRSFKSRYSLDVSYALYTACTVVNSRGELSSRFVKMNSNLLPWNRVMTYSDCVFPRNRDDAVFIEMFDTELYPMLRFVRRDRLLNQITRRFVTTSVPRSPLLPFVSSTPSRWSISNSPFLSARPFTAMSNLISRSCHTDFGSSGFLASGIATRARFAPRPFEVRTRH